MLGAVDAVVIGASAGAIDALATILPSLPAHTPFPVVIVVHLPAGRPSLVVELFAPRCSLAVRLATDKAPITPGIWFAPPGYHVLVEAERTFALSVDDPVNFSRPSIDVLFESAADAYRERLIAIALTGASSDGANGARAVRERGGMVVVQDPTTAEATMLPTTAIERARPQKISSVPDIARFLTEVAGRSPA